MPSTIRTALVTGATSGLGFETCRQLAARGFRVLFTGARPPEALRQAAAPLVQAGLPVEPVPVPLDVADPASVAAVAAHLRDGGASIDVLVNNAGVSLDGFDAEVARRTLAVNFFGPLRVTEALLPLVPDGGAIVMVSSGMGELGGIDARLRPRFADPELTRDKLVALVETFVADVAAARHQQQGWPSNAYRVSKVALNALVRAWAPELARRHILINAVCPGWVRTDMGGPAASRDVEKGAASIVWAATREGEPTGGFFRDGRRIEW